jgi:plastocyanin
MVKFTSFITTALVLSTYTVALPTKDQQLSQYGSDSSSGYGSSNSGYSSSNSGYDSSNSGYGSSNSGYGSSNSGYGSSNSGGYGESNNSGYGGSSNSGYGSSGNSNGYDNQSTKTTEQAMTTTSTSVMHDTTTTAMMSDTTTSTVMTTESPAATSSIIYGSGSMGSGSSEYNDCVQQCVAQFPPSGTGINSGSSDNGGGSAGTGATKTVIVAPSQGVLRYVPFAVNASVGDTIKFVWNANKHTVSQGSAPLPCNQTSGGFTTDLENMGFSFTQVVNTTDPVFFFCAAPGHCQKGMFGVINMASNINAPTSASGMMQSLKANNSDLKSYAAVVDKQTINTPAYTWGGNLDMSNVPDWAQPFVAENILYTRSFLANNPEVMGEDGTVDMSGANTPLMYPQDMQDAIKNAATSTPPSNPPADPAGAAATTSASGTEQTGKPSGAISNIPSAVTAIGVALATLLIL